MTVDDLVPNKEHRRQESIGLKEKKLTPQAGVIREGFMMESKTVLGHCDEHDGQRGGTRLCVESKQFARSPTQVWA